MGDLREVVRDHYARAARSVEADEVVPTSAPGCGCDPGCCSDGGGFGSGLYTDAFRAEAPDAALLASLGCGNPTAVAELQAGETVLDLGSGGGLDVLLSAKRVGPSGKAYGLDMTEEMLALALANKERAGAKNVEFLKGYIEEIPLPAATVDVVISNCVVNLSLDKDRVFAEMFRVLRPGGRVAVTDVVADKPADERHADPALWAACIAGALTRQSYREKLEGAGFQGVEIVDTHGVGDGFASAIVRAHKPSTVPVAAARQRNALPVIQPDCC